MLHFLRNNIVDFPTVLARVCAAMCILVELYLQLFAALCRTCL